MATIRVCLSRSRATASERAASTVCAGSSSTPWLSSTSPALDQAGATILSIVESSSTIAATLPALTRAAAAAFSTSPTRTRIPTVAVQRSLRACSRSYAVAHSLFFPGCGAWALAASSIVNAVLP